jgi:hypothetical protein
MNTIFRMTERMLAAIHDDLSRPHEFALERVGFIACRTAALDGGTAILAETYHPVHDHGYAPSERFGALMNASAIRGALAIAYRERVSMFHVHRHEHAGVPEWSGIDLRESAKFVPNFWNVVPRKVHGTIVLSYDRANGLAWWPGTTAGQPIEQIVAVGRPIRILKEKTDGRAIRPAELSRRR